MDHMCSLNLCDPKGLKAVMYMYLDNGICAIKGKIHVEAKKASAWVKGTIECASLVVHEGKSVWFPSHSTAWLGFDADLERGCVCHTSPLLEECPTTSNPWPAGLLVARRSSPEFYGKGIGGGA